MGRKESNQANKHIVVTFWERANLLALLYVMFSCVFVTCPCGVLGQVWYLIVSIPDICLLTYFCNHIAGEERAGCLTFIVFWVIYCCYCILPLTHGVVG